MRPVSHVSWSKIMLDALKLFAVPGSCATPCKTQTFRQIDRENQDWEQVDSKIRDWEKTMEHEIDHENRDWEQVDREIRDWEKTIEYEIDREIRDWEQVDREIRDWKKTIEYVLGRATPAHCERKNDCANEILYRHRYNRIAARRHGRLLQRLWRNRR
jgi:hypothetical protein